MRGRKEWTNLLPLEEEKRKCQGCRIRKKDIKQLLKECSRKECEGWRRETLLDETEQGS